MELKRAIKKLPSEQNLRLLSSLIISLANKVDSTSEKCINPFTPNTAYAKGSYVTHDNYIYESKIACNDADWVESHWVRLSDTIEELSVDTVKSWLNLSQEELYNLQSLIDDTAITTTKTNSSSKIYMDIQAAIAECKNDTLKQIAKKVSGSYKIASSTSEVTSADFIYLINNGVNYDLYVLVDSVPTRVGDTSVNFDNYYTKTEVDSDFLKKTDATSTYATITTVDGKVDKTDIATTIDSSSTNDTVTGTKAIYDYILANTDKFDVRGYAGDLDDVPFTISNATHCYLIYNSSCTNIPNNLTGTLYNTYFGDAAWATQLFIGLEGSIYTRNKANGTWSSWERYLRTADVVTTIDSTSTNDKVPSAKAIYNKSKNKTTDLPNGTDIIAYADSISNETVADTVRIMNAPNSPYATNIGSDFHYTIYNITDDGYKRIVAYDIRKNDMYMIMKHSGTWGTWRKVCTTSVKDVPKTRIELPNISPEFATGYIEFEVYNGVCYMAMFNLAFANTSTGNLLVNIPGIPKRKNDGWHTISNVTSLKPLFVNIGANGGAIEFYTAREVGTSYYGTFSYQVAES